MDPLLIAFLKIVTRVATVTERTYSRSRRNIAIITLKTKENRIVVTNSAANRSESYVRKTAYFRITLSEVIMDDGGRHCADLQVLSGLALAEEDVLAL